MSDVINTRLLAVAGVTAIVGVGAAARIYPVEIAQGAILPAITYQRITGPKISAMGADTGLTRPLFQVDCWAETYREADDLAEAVRAALQRWKDTVLGIVVQQTTLENMTDLHEDEDDTHRVSMDFRFSHLEA